MVYSDLQRAQDERQWKPMTPRLRCLFLATREICPRKVKMNRVGMGQKWERYSLLLASFITLFSSAAFLLQEPDAFLPSKSLLLLK